VIKIDKVKGAQFMRLRTKYIVSLGLFTALVFIFTYFPIFRIDYGVGYFNLGDIPLILASVLIAPELGALAGAIGAGFGDLFAGYALFIPFTIIAKGLEGYVAGKLFRSIRHPYLKYLAIPVGTLMMVATYQVSYLFIDPAYQIAGLFLDLGQATAASLISVTLIAILKNRFQLFQRKNSR
jgi:uncharacterized membrane protein